jgi:hypothetical protein
MILTEGTNPPTKRASSTMIFVELEKFFISMNNWAPFLGDEDDPAPSLSCITQEAIFSYKQKYWAYQWLKIIDKDPEDARKVESDPVLEDTPVWELDKQCVLRYRETHCLPM